MIKGIDISHWNTITDFAKVKKSGIDFAIIKAGGSDKGFYKDSKFEYHYEMCKLNSIEVGAYYFVGKNCITYADGVADAKRFLELIKGKKFEYPVYIDLEATSTKDKKGATDAVIGFCETMESNHYYTGVYSSDISGYKERLENNRLNKFDKWVARYGKSPEYVKHYGIWQYTSKGQIEGIKGNVDLNLSYIKYLPIMVRNGLNGYGV